MGELVELCQEALGTYASCLFYHRWVIPGGLSLLPQKPHALLSHLAGFEMCFLPCISKTSCFILKYSPHFPCFGPCPCFLGKILWPWEEAGWGCLCL